MVTSRALGSASEHLHRPQGLGGGISGPLLWHQVQRGHWCRTAQGQGLLGDHHSRAREDRVAPPRRKRASRGSAAQGCPCPRRHPPHGPFKGHMSETGGPLETMLFRRDTENSQVTGTRGLAGRRGRTPWDQGAGPRLSHPLCCLSSPPAGAPPAPSARGGGPQPCLPPHLPDGEGPQPRLLLPP